MKLVYCKTLDKPKRKNKVGIRQVYRVENPQTEHGMWYDKNGIYQPIIDIICPNGVSKDLPMDFDYRHKVENKEWYSSGSSIANMQEWFSFEDITSLLKNGFQLYEFDVTEWTQIEHEILFTRESIIDRRIIPTETIWF